MNRIPYPPRVLAGTRTDYRTLAAGSSPAQILGADACRSRVTLSALVTEVFTSTDVVCIGVMNGATFVPVASLDATIRTVTLLVEDIGDPLVSALFVVSPDNVINVAAVSISRDIPEA